METKLERISQLSRENPETVFTSIGHLIDVNMLKACHEKMDGKKAVGIDGVTKEEYGRNLEQNLQNLVGRLKNKSYKPLGSIFSYLRNQKCKVYDDYAIPQEARKEANAIYDIFKVQVPYKIPLTTIQV